MGEETKTAAVPAAAESRPADRGGENAGYIYDAFISYRHCPLDQYVAEILHKRLEAFRLPKGVQKRLSDNSRTKIERVFRDREELPLASNLAEPITRALEDSEFLIVICTPRLPESSWCRKEIETFTALHGREKILAVLAEGEPGESFPKELVQVKETSIGADGQILEQIRMVEPLAADVRGGSRREIRRKINTELLRLAAAMCGCGYDELRQRHRERRMKRILAVSCTAAAFFLGFGAFSTAMALRIQGQKEQISQQKERIEAQAQEIQEQYKEVLRSQAVLSARESERLLEEGDRQGAIRLAAGVLRDTWQEQTYTPQAQYALTESLYLYENNSTIRPIRLLEQEGVIEQVQVSPEGGYALVQDDAGNLALWELSAGKKIMEQTREALFYYESQTAFLTEEYYAYPVEQGIAVCSVMQSEQPRIVPCGYYEGIYADPGRGLFLVAGEDGLSVWDTQGLERIMEYPYPENWEFAGPAVFDADGRFLAVMLEEGSGEEYRSQAAVFSMTDRKLLYTVEIKEKAEALLFDELHLYIAANTRLDYLTGFELSDSSSGYLYCLDSGTGVDQWMIQENARIYGCYVGGRSGEERLIYHTYETAVLAEPETGEEYGRVELGRELVSVIPIQNAATSILFTRDGKFHYLNLETAQAFYQENKFRSASDNVKAFHAANRCFLLQSYSDNHVEQYAFAADPQLRSVVETEDLVLSLMPDTDGNKIAVITYGDSKALSVYDRESGERRWSVPLEEGSVDLIAVKSETAEAVLADDQKIQFFDLEDGSLRKTLELEDYAQIQGTDQSNSYLLAADSAGMYALSLESGERTGLSGEEWESQEHGIFSISATMRYTAAVSLADRCIYLYDRSQDGPPARLEVNAAYLSGLCFGTGDSILYVSYKNGKTEAYRTKDLELAASYDSMGSIERADDMEEAAVLCSGTEGWLTDRDGALLARIPGYAGLLPKEEAFLLTSGSTVYSVPVYSLEQILHYAQECLGYENEVLR